MGFVRKHLWVFLLGLSLTLMSAGILRGEALEVLQKAIFVCFECIGIG